MSNAISRRLARIEAQQALNQPPLPSRFFYNILDNAGLSYDNFWVAGPNYGDLRPATSDEISMLKSKHELQQKSSSAAVFCK